MSASPLKADIGSAVADRGHVCFSLIPTRPWSKNRGCINDDTRAGLLKLSYEVRDIDGRLIELTANIYEQARPERK